MLIATYNARPEFLGYPGDTAADQIILGSGLGLPVSLFLDSGYTSISRFLAASSGERSVGSLNETGHLRA